MCHHLSAARTDKVQSTLAFIAAIITGSRFKNVCADFGTQYFESRRLVKDKKVPLWKQITVRALLDFVASTWNATWTCGGPHRAARRTLRAWLGTRKPDFSFTAHALGVELVVPAHPAFRVRCHFESYPRHRYGVVRSDYVRITPDASVLAVRAKQIASVLAVACQAPPGHRPRIELVGMHEGVKLDLAGPRADPIWDKAKARYGKKTEGVLDRVVIFDQAKVARAGPCVACRRNTG
ncbi:hypothetical protein Q5752_004456 [Cryptotrichosporon argae]